MQPSGVLSRKVDNLPTISIVTPSYNQGLYLEKTIVSVLSQQYPRLEFIVIDGQSNDDSVEIIKRYANQLTYWESEPDTGQSHALNKGFARATGEILCWLNSDDIFSPGALFAIAEEYSNNPKKEIGAIVGYGDIRKLSGEVVSDKRPTTVNLRALLDWKKNALFMQPSCFFTRDAWLQCGPLNESLHYVMDWDLWLKIAKKYEFSVLPRMLSHSLAHPDAKTTSHFDPKPSAEGAIRSLNSDMELAIVLAYHGFLDQAKTLLDTHSKNFQDLQNSRAFRLAKKLQSIKNIFGS